MLVAAARAGAAVAEGRQRCSCTHTHLPQLEVAALGAEQHVDVGNQQLRQPLLLHIARRLGRIRRLRGGLNRLPGTAASCGI